MITAKKVIIKSKSFRSIKKLYQQAFPENEKLPIWILVLMSLRKCVDFYSFYDKNVFCGFTYLIHYKKMTFVLYLATDSSVRSKGYGAGILDWIEKAYQENSIVLNIETVSEKYDNFEQRLKRQKFYYNNGFQDTGYTLYDKKDIYDVLITKNSANFSEGEYKNLFRRFSFGFITINLVRKN
ncbi:GNAT family N-acetyltransferase [Anaeromicropila herbilytica]|uniref:N-acetyltransferase n=1 Tax=Anaeromicropila herbilytica TaxID=2785025 RepID=A0A7R7EN62_9FIRM|nr:GNAT family N-acetyltransferase [Anaeromicropila herbilytica]BCN31829.1 N-acetyltransferase [Anaeromicropila herbilytica]